MEQLQPAGARPIRVACHHVAPIPADEGSILFVLVVEGVTRDPSLGLASHSDLEYDLWLAIDEGHGDVFVYLEGVWAPVGVAADVGR